MLKLQFRDQPGSSVKLSASTVTLGRDESNDVVIDSQSVSDFHAEISTDAQFPVIIDLLSANGTFVNDRRISSRHQLQPWDIVRLGTVELEVTDPNAHRPQDWALRSESDLLASRFHALDTSTVIGRDPACDLTIDDNLLSRRHARLLLEGDCLKVIDLGSANGTFLNGEKIQDAVAHPGDELRFDQHCFIVVGPVTATADANLGKAEQTLIRGNEDDATMIGSATVMEPLADSPLPPESEPGDTLPMADEETLLFAQPPPAATLKGTGPTVDLPEFTLDQELLTLGRGEQSDIVLDDKSVSKRHAEFAFEHGGWSIRDLGSSNGVAVNNERVDHMRLQHGDIIQFGRLELVFQLAAGPQDTDDSVTRVFEAPLIPPEVDRPAAESAGGGRTLHYVIGTLIAMGCALGAWLLLVND
jgi:pSer/pThr/pTyr-binding forkhead associated (FHA) protein